MSEPEDPKKFLKESDYNFLFIHVFLSRKLPQDGKETQIKEKSVLNLLVSALLKTMKNIELQEYSRKIAEIYETFETWRILQTPEFVDENLLAETIFELQQDHILPFYLWSQNSCFIIKILKPEHEYRAIISNFQVSVNNKEILSTSAELAGVYPNASFYVKNLNIINSFPFLHHLAEWCNIDNEEFMSNSIEDIKDVKSSCLVSEWLSAMLCANATIAYELRSIVKKIRDDVLFSEELVPFRRSGMWMCAKAVLQLLFCNIFTESTGKILYKIVILNAHIKIAKNMKDTSCDNKLQIIQKIAKRVYKLNFFYKNENNVAINQIKKQANNVIVLLKNTMNKELLKIEGNSRSLSAKIDLTKIKFKHKNLKMEFVLESLNRLRILQKSSWTCFKDESRTIKRNNKIYEVPDCKQLDPSKPNELAIHLYDIESWVFHSLDSCISINPKNLDLNLMILLEKYIEIASSFYKFNPISNSRMVLTALGIVVGIDRIACIKFPMLLEHHSGLEKEIIESLLIQKSSDLSYALSIFDYISTRNSKSKYRSLIDSKELTNENSFGFRYFSNDKTMQELKKKIETKAKYEKEWAENLLIKTREDCEWYLNESKKNKCSKPVTGHGDDKAEFNKCNHCFFSWLSKNKTADIYEWPLPKKKSELIIFELKIPDTIAYLRDCLHIIKTKIYGFKEDGEKIIKSWIDNEYLRQFANRHQKYVSIGSTTDLWVISHGPKLKVSNQSKNKEFFPDNGMNTFLSTREKPLNYTHSTNIKNITSFKAQGLFRSLDWTISNTTHSENKVIANQGNCSIELKLNEYIKYGSFRVGNNLQLFNILELLETRELSIKFEEVYNLIAQSLWEVGPIQSFDKRLIQKYPESHYLWTQKTYLKSLEKSLYDIIDSLSKNWNDHISILNIIIIASRAASFSLTPKYKQKFSITMRKCRKICKNWEISIEKNIEQMSGKSIDETEIQKEKLLEVACFSVFTYHIDKEFVSMLLSTQEDVVDWFSSLSKIYDYEILNTNKNDSNFRRNLLRQVNLICVEIESQISEIALMENGRPLSEFVRIRWSDSIKGNCTYWVKNDAEYCFAADFNSFNTGSSKVIKVGLDGAFFIEDQPIGKLPQSICNHPLFKDFFESTDFDVQPSNKGNHTLTSKPIQFTKNYETSFSFFLDFNDLVITERKTNKETLLTDEFLLIPRNLFVSLLPTILLNEYSHWLHLQDDKILFKPKKYSDKSYYESVTFSLDLKKCRLKEISTNKKLIDKNSATFSEIYNKIGKRLETDNFIHVFTHRKKITVDFPRLGINIEIQNDTGLYRGLKISENQQIGTLFGLEKGLVLIDSSSTSENIKKKILIPHGFIKIREGLPHQKIKIDCQLPRKPEFFVYDIDSRLKILRAGESLSAWLYLAWLHGATSTTMPDPFLGISGTAMALQLLQSSICWSVKPLSLESNVTLNEIAKLSPLRKFYKENIEIQSIEWPFGLPSMAAHDCFLFLVQKIINDSNRLSFAFDDPNVSTIDEVYKENLNFLSSKAYYRYYNSSYRLSKDFKSLLKFKPETKLVFDSRNVWSQENILNTRKVALNHFGPSKTFNIKEIIMEKNPFEIKSLVEINLNSLSEWFKISDNFFDYLIGLYKEAKSVNTFEDFINFNMLLSFLAYKGNPLDEILLLQTVLNNQNIFYDINNPEYAKYESLYWFNYNPENISEILKKKFINSEEYFAKYEKTKPNELNKYYNPNLQKEYNKVKIERVQATQRIIASKWPCDKISDLYSTDYSNETIPAINAKLLLWYKNSLLNKFLNELQQVLQNLDLNSDTLIMPELKILPKTKINFPKLFFQYTFKIDIEDDYINEILAESSKLYSSGNIFYEDFRITKETQSEKIIPKFPFIKNNHDSMVQKYYLKELKNSWKIYHKTQSKINLLDTKILIILLKKTLERYRKKITEYQNFIEKVFFPKNYVENCLYLSGIWPILTPKKIFKYMLEKPKGFLTIDPKIIDLLGALTVLWTLEQRILRCISYAEVGNSQSSALQRELENKPYENWSPRSKPEWLILEVELDMMIRRIQVEVAEKMMNPPNSKNTVMQLNMGEGKTALIIPMLAASLSNSDNLVRITVLKSLLNINYDALVQKLGGFLNRRVYIFPCRRDKKFDENNMILIQNLLKECKKLKGIVLTLPEYRLSFSLKGLEMCNSSKESKLAEELIKTEQWLKKHTRDILDESDEILNVKYQLVYTIGKQSQITCGPLRWQVSQAVLEIAKTHFKDLKAQFGDDSVFYETNPFFVMAYPRFRFLNNDAYEVFCRKICFDILKGRSSEINFLELRSNDVENVIEFIIKQEPNPSIRQKIDSIIPVNTQARDIILILTNYNLCFESVILEAQI